MPGDLRLANRLDAVVLEAAAGFEGVRFVASGFGLQLVPLLFGP